MKAVVHREDLDHNPYVLWNTFVRLLGTAALEQFADNQRPAHLAFCYDAEVQNGGHQQFFENRPPNLLDETIRSLDGMGASSQASILRRAAERRQTKARKRPRTVEEYAADSMKMEFSDLDEAYYSTSPTVTELLERLLNKQADDFLEVIG